MRRHHATVSSSRRSRGTTVFTRPIAKASLASYCRHRNQISRGPSADTACQQARPVAGVEGADPWAGLAEAGVVGCDREIADHVEHVATADRVAGRPWRRPAWEPSDLYLQIEDVEAADARLPPRPP